MEQALIYGYDSPFILISIAIAAIASYSSLVLTSRIFDTQGCNRLSYLLGATFSIGTGVWLLHLIAAMQGVSTIVLMRAVSSSTLLIISLTWLFSFLNKRFGTQTPPGQVLQDDQNSLQTILHGVRVGVLVIESGHEISLLNHAVLELLELTEEQLHQTWQACLTGADSSSEALETYHPVLTEIATHPTLLNAVIEGPANSKIGKRWLLVNAIPQCSVDGKHQQLICTFCDVTDLKLAEQALQVSEAENCSLARLAEAKSQQLSQTLDELRQTQSRIVHQEKMSSLGQMVAGIAHEVNNPVTFIYGNIDYVSQYTQDLLNLVQLFRDQRKILAPEIRSQLQAIDFDFILEDLPRLFKSMKLGAERIREIVSSLRNFARLDEADVKSVNIHEGIDSTLMILSHKLKGMPHKTPIQIVKEYGNLPLVECYAGQINQVFMNVLSNAIDALDEVRDLERPIVGTNKFATGYVPTIQISTELINQGDRIKICISDNGSGIPSTVQEKMFDPFYTTKPIGKGTGLGLFISYQIVVEHHKGSLSCNSRPGEGTEVQIEIPITQNKPQKVVTPKLLETELQRI